MDSGQLRQQNGEEGREQAFAAYSGVVHELEEPQVQRQLLLRDAAMGAQPFDELRTAQ
jgi:hypothetical protein